MTKYAAFGTHLEIGTAQILTGEVICPTGEATSSNNISVDVDDATVNITAVIALLNEDIEAVIAQKIVVGLLLEADVIAKYSIYSHGPFVVLERLLGAADDPALEMIWTYAGTGITANAASVDTEAGIAQVEVAAVKNIGGPALSLDSDDVTTHDSTAYWEEVVATILRTGEMPLEIVYDPADDTHDATATNGLAYRLKNKDRTFFDLRFMGGALRWKFFGWVTSFEPGAPVGAHLSAAVKVKITGQPTLYTDQ